MVANYIDYFRQLAVQHKDLRHDPQTETGDGDIGAQHFTRISVDEVTAAMRTGISSPLLALELYEIDTASNNATFVQVNPAGAFMIVARPDDRTFAAQEACFVLTEQIARDLLQKLWADTFRPQNPCSAPFENVDFDTVSLTPVGPVFDGWYGYRVIFHFTLQPNEFCLSAPPAPGTFIN